MAVATQTGVPAQIRSGNTHRFIITDADHPVATWSCKLYLMLDGQFVTSYAASESASGYSFVITAGQSSQLKAGSYSWTLRFTETGSGEIEDGETGVMQVLRNVAVAQAKSTARIMLDSLNTAITTLAAGTNSSVSFNGQSFTKKDMGSLLRQRAMLQAEVHREEQAEKAVAGENAGNFFQVRFQ